MLKNDFFFKMFFIHLNFIHKKTTLSCLNMTTDSVWQLSVGSGSGVAQNSFWGGVPEAWVWHVIN